jgi:hypothetical protein
MDELSRIPASTLRRQRWQAAALSALATRSPGSSIAVVIVLHGRIIAGHAIHHEAQIQPVFLFPPKGWHIVLRSLHMLSALSFDFRTYTLVIKAVRFLSSTIFLIDLPVQHITYNALMPLNRFILLLFLGTTLGLGSRPPTRIGDTNTPVPQ